MSKHHAIEAVFEDGVFRPLAKVKLPEHQQVSIVITVKDDLPAQLLARVAENDGSFAFLTAHAEDLYSPNDGEAV